MSELKISVCDKVEELKRDGYILHHVSYVEGYISSKSYGLIEEYHGRFGEGYKIHTPDIITYLYKGTWYHYIYYIIKK